MISFNEIPNNIRIPIFAVEFNSVNAVRGAQFQQYKTLIIGQKSDFGTAEYNNLYRINNKKEADNYFGSDSMLSEMVDSYRKVDKLTELYAIAVPDVQGAVKATANINMTGSINEPGIIFIYIAGKRLSVPVKMGIGKEEVFKQIAKVINANKNLPVIAFATTDKLTLEAKNAGEIGNDIDVRFNYYSGENFPSGTVLSATKFTGGVANPEIIDALARARSEWFNAFVMPYTDLNNLFVMTEELNEKWKPLVMQEGWLFTAKRGTHGELGNFAKNRNSKYEIIFNCSGIPNSPWAVASSVAANAMYYGNMDPARPFQTLPLIGILPPKIEDKFSDLENNQLLYDGLSTFNVDLGGNVNIGRLITTYKKTANGADDTSYLDLNTGLTLGYLRWDFRNHFLRKFPRHKLGGDGVRYSPTQAILTPKQAKVECLNKYHDWEERGLVENYELFKKELVVERNNSDVNRLDFYLPPDLINQFIVGAAQIAFYL